MIIPVTIASLSPSFLVLILTNSCRRLSATSVLLSTNSLTGWFRLSLTSSSTCKGGGARGLSLQCQQHIYVVLHPPRLQHQLCKSSVLLDTCTHVCMYITLYHSAQGKHPLPGKLGINVVVSVHMHFPNEQVFKHPQALIKVYMYMKVNV